MSYNDFDDVDYAGHKESAAKFMVSVLAVVIALISMSTTFGFFSTFFGNFFSAEAIGTEYAQIASGIVGVILFDLGAVIALQAFLNAARTSEQRAISVFLLIFNFTLSAIASMAHIYLTASTDLYLDPALLSQISNIAVIAVVIGVVVNFGLWIAYAFYSQEAKMKRIEHKRQDALNTAQARQLGVLAQSVGQKVEEYLQSEADGMAAAQARSLADTFRKREMTRYANHEQDEQPALPLPPTQPIREYTRADRVNFQNGDRNGR